MLTEKEALALGRQALEKKLGPDILKRVDDYGETLLDEHQINT